MGDFKIVQNVPDTRRGDDGVQISTPRSRNEVDGALWAIFLIMRSWAAY